MDVGKQIRWERSAAGVVLRMAALALLGVFFLVGCGDDGADTEDADTPTDSEVADADTSGSASGETSTSEAPAIELSQGDVGEVDGSYWYDVELSGFEPGSTVTVACNDSIDEKFWEQDFTIAADGTAADETLCYSADGPDHWVTTEDGIRSNTVSWNG